MAVMEDMGIYFESRGSCRSMFRETRRISIRIFKRCSGTSISLQRHTELHYIKEDGKLHL